MNVFLWGFSGSGKTAISLETVKIKVSHCKEKNKPVRVIVTTYTARDDKQLLKSEMILVLQSNLRLQTCLVLE